MRRALCQIFFSLLLIAQYFCSYADEDCNCTETISQFDSFRNTVLKRRVRSAIFPTRAALLLTPSFAKAILGGKPRGLLYAVEFDMYTPVPDTVEGWEPTIFIKKLERRIKAEKAEKEAVKNEPVVTPAPAPPPITMDALDHSNFTFGEYYNYADDYFPGPIEYEKYIYPLDELKPTDHRRIDNYKTSLPNYYKSRERIQNFYARNPQNKTYANYYQAAHNSFKKPFFKTPQRTTYVSKKNFRDNQYHRKGTYSNMWSPGSQRNVYYAKSNTPKWKHFSQNYRERREIYEQLLTVGKIFNFDMKACIKRAMCEVNTYLKPYGVSLMEDIVRILLTVPSSVNDGNEYNFKTVNCVQKFAISCPYRVLEILTGNMRPYQTT